MSKMVHIASTIALLSFGWLSYRASVAVDLLPAIVERQATMTRARLMMEVSQWRKTTDGNINATLALTEREVTALRRDGLAEVAATREVIDRRLGAMQATLDRTVALVDERTAELEPIPEHAAAVLETYAATGKHLESITAQVDDALPLLLDCEMTEDCIQWRTAAVLRSTETAMDAVAEHAPRTTAGVAATAENVGKITSPTLWNWITKVGVTIGGALLSRPTVVVERRTK